MDVTFLLKKYTILVSKKEVKNLKKDSEKNFVFLTYNENFGPTFKNAI